MSCVTTPSEPGTFNQLVAKDGKDIRKIMVDTNVWLNYFLTHDSDKNADHYVRMKKFIDDGINSGIIQTTKTIKDEAQHVFERELHKRKNELDKGANFYKIELTKKLKNSNIEDVKKPGDKHSLYDRIQNMYDVIWEDPNEKYAKKKEYWAELKFRYNPSGKKWDNLTPDEKQTQINKFELSYDDRTILATTAYLKTMMPKSPVILLTYDADFWVFTREIRDEFTIAAVRPWDLLK